LEPTECVIPGRVDCRRVTVELRGGADEGRRETFSSGETAGDADLGLGDRILVYQRPGAAAAEGGAGYVFLDFDRTRPLLLLAGIFAALVLVLGRWQGLRSLAGLVGSLAVVVYFVVPAILEGSSPAGVSLVGALAVMFLTLPLAHGIGPKTVAASLGTATSLTLTLGLATVATESAHLSGLASDEAAFLRAASTEVSLSGLLVAGMVIGALGVLDDLTVSQASTVMALRSANTTLGARELFRRALSVGRDHIAATVNTLVLAYAGAALPILLIFSLGGWSFGDAVTSEVVAEQVVATIVGSIGLIAAVPITTGLAAFLATRLEPAALGTEHGHTH
jgi:uncharacterized membrane protein